MTFEITLAGEVAIRRDGRILTGPLSGVQARGVFAVLVLESPHGVSRDRLADAVWADSLPRTWQAALRTFVSRVRRFMADAFPDARDALTSGAGRYTLCLPADTVVDVKDVEHRLAESRALLAAGAASSALRQAERTAEQARRPFLPDLGSDWAQARRDQLAATLVGALETISEAARLLGDVDRALAVAEEAVERAPLRESAHRCRMAAHAAAGNRAEALRAYQRLRYVLVDELGVDPSPETESAYLDLLGSSPPSVVAPSDPRRLREGVRSWAGRGSTHASPFVGRRAELAALMEAWSQTVSDSSRLVLVSGEAGIGKTHLARQAARHVSAEGGLVLFGHCDEQAIVPYQPFVEALDPLIATAPRGELTGLTDITSGSLATVLPSFGNPLPRHGTPVGQVREFDAIVDLVVGVAAERPTLLILDNLHWADRDTLLLLRQVLRRSDRARILVVATLRSHDVAYHHMLRDVVHALDREGWVRRVPLRGLDVHDVRSLVRLLRVERNGDRRATDLAPRLVAETAGNPFLVVQLLRSGEPVDQRRIPWGVHELVASCLARLEPAAVDLLRAGAVSGSAFALDIAAFAAHLDETTALDALDSLLDSGVVAEDAPNRYHFVHDIVRQSIVVRLSGARLRTLHRGLADAIETLRPDDLSLHAPSLAHHSALGATPGGDVRAVRWSRTAARHAEQASAPAEAVRLHRQALGHAPPDDPDLRADILVDLGIALQQAGDRSGHRTLVEGANLARRSGRFDVVARAALALAQQARHDPNTRWAAVSLLDAALPEAPGQSLTQACLWARRIALGAGDPEPPPGVVRVLREAVATCDGPDALGRRLELSTDLETLAAAAHDVGARAAATHQRAMVAAVTGHSEMVVDALADLARMANGDPWLHALTSERAAAEATFKGRFAEAAAHVEQAVQRHARRRRTEPAETGADDAGLVTERHYVVLAWMQGTLADWQRPVIEPAALALLEVERGRPAQADVVLGEIVDGVRPLPSGDGWLHAAGVTALAAAELGDPALAAAVRGLLSPYAELMCGVGYRSFVGAVAHHMGCLAAVVGDQSDAERHLMVALRHHTALGARPWTALTNHRLADVLEARNRPADRDWVAALRSEAGALASNLGMRRL